MSFFNQNQETQSAPVVSVRNDIDKWVALKGAVDTLLDGFSVTRETVGTITDSFIFDLAVELRKSGNLPSAVEPDSFDGNDLRQILVELWEVA